MDFFDELRWRGMLYDMTPGAEEELKKGMSVGYIGFDPTAQSLTIGNYVQVMILTLWQESGHQPIVLMGGATGRIGDPSGKDKERQLKSYEELDQNLDLQIGQFEKFLDFHSKSPNRALLRNNIDFYRDMDVLTFLRKVGKTLTVSYMLSKDSVKNRLESGLSFTEFSYQLLQAYDFQCLYEKENCRFQMGGSDQWGNITSGTEFIRRNLDDAKAYAVTTPLLTKSDGQKFGKSEEGNIWLDRNMTSPYKFYQFWINADDADIPKFTRYFTLRSRHDVETMERDLTDDPRRQKLLLAEELTKRIHSPEDYTSVHHVSKVLFDKKLTETELRSMSGRVLEMVAREIPSMAISYDILVDAPSLQSILTEHSAIFASNSEFRRSIQNKALSVNKEKVVDIDARIQNKDLVSDRYIMIENGRKNKYLLVFS